MTEFRFATLSITDSGLVIELTGEGITHVRTVLLPQLTTITSTDRWRHDQVYAAPEVQPHRDLVTVLLLAELLVHKVNTQKFYNDHLLHGPVNYDLSAYESIVVTLLRSLKIDQF